MTMGVKDQKIANLGRNVKTLVKNENCMVFMLSDSTGEGVMTVYQVMPGVMICFSDIHMEKCTSEFELKQDMKVLCIEQTDQILVIDDGQIVQRGTHRELVGIPGKYKDFVDIRKKSEGWSIAGY